jgi:hypothetical protein
MTIDRSGELGSPAKRCSKNSIGRTSTGCRQSPIPLPSRRVGVDYHVELEGHFYSVPRRFARSEVEVRLTPRVIEIFLKGERIAGTRPVKADLRSGGGSGW